MVEDSMEIQSKTSFKTKQARRTKKYSNVLKREYNLDSSTDNPTLILAVCNAGLASGLSREQLLHLVLPFGPVKNVILIPGKSSAFIEFYSKDVAEQVYQELNGKTVPQIKQGEIFLAYVETVPEENCSSVTPVELPSGLTIIPHFVSKDEETQLLNCIQWTPSDPQSGQSLKHRKVRHYGYQFNYDTNNVDPDSPLDDDIPEACTSVVNNLVSQNIVPWKPDQLTVNQYQPGQGIPSHIDTHSAFEDPILSLSLGAEVVMEFRCGDQVVPLLLPRRSLLVMSGESRYIWTHGITPRKSDIIPSADGGITLQNRAVRTSFTLRRLRRAPCTCIFPQYCDSQQSKEPILEQQAAQLESLHVHQVYDKIVDHFSDTRHKPWPNVLSFVQSQPVGCIMLDIGCGNGKYLGLNKLAYQLGCDSSTQLAKVCRQRNHEVFTCNCLCLPFRSNSVDCCISIAVIHHLSTRERRVQAIIEMSRVLRQGGQALIYVWAKDQKKDRVSSNYLRQTRLPSQTEVAVTDGPFSLPVHTNRTQFAHSDMFVPWKMRPNQGTDCQSDEKVNDQACDKASQEVFYRYYHVFEEGELETLCKLVPGIQIIKSYYDQGNWCVIFEKNGLN